MTNIETYQQLRVLSGIEFHHALRELESKMMDLLPEDQKIDPPLKHYFATNVYVREMVLKEGEVLIGKTHRHDHIFNMIKGRAVVFSEQGHFVLNAPFTFTAEKGAKRMFFAVEDCIFQTTHVTSQTDLAEIEKEVIVPPEEIDAFRQSHGMEV